MHERGSPVHAAEPELGAITTDNTGGIPTVNFSLCGRFVDRFDVTGLFLVGRVKTHKTDIRRDMHRRTQWDAKKRSHPDSNWGCLDQNQK